jgi:hypothetical protein
MTWTAPPASDNSINIPSFGSGAAITNSVSSSTVTATVSLSITVTGTWQPASGQTLQTDPAPTTVIVAENSTATSVGSKSDSSGSSTGAAGPTDDSLGQGDPQDPSTGVQQGIKYVSPDATGGTFTVSLTSLSASGSVTCGAGYTDDDGNFHTTAASCSATVGPIIVTAYPITVDITGSTSNSNPLDFLIGQKVNAALNTHGLPSFSTDTYSWSITGGSPFDFYNNDGTYYPLWSLQLIGYPFAYAYFATPGTGVFTCDANLAGLPVAPTKSVSVVAPSFTTPTVSIGTPTLGVDSSGDTGVVLTFTSFASPAGIKWTCSVTTPDEFIITSQTNGESDYGNWEWIQLLTQDNTFVDTDGTTHVESMQPPAPASITPLYSQYFLDAVCPYPYWRSSDGFYSDGNQGATAPADGTSYWDGDAPDIMFGSDEVSWSVDEAFKDTLMYCPPGGSSCYVPLNETDWEWGWDATLSSTTGAWSMSYTTAPYYENAGNFPSFPTWLYAVIANATYGTVNISFPPE